MEGQVSTIIRNIRKRNNHSQEQMAYNLGYSSQNVISRVERGATGLTPRLFNRLMKTYIITYAERETLHTNMGSKGRRYASNINIKNKQTS